MTVTEPGNCLLALGRVQAVVDCHVHVPSPAVADVLAVLLINGCGPLTTGNMMDLGWNKSAWQSAVSRTRRWLSEVSAQGVDVEFSDGAYVLSTADFMVDTLRFDELVSGERGSTDRLDRLRRALALFRGVPADGARQRIRESQAARIWNVRRATAVKEATDLALGSDLAAAIRDVVHNAVVSLPESEYVQASWALLLSDNGQHSEALRHLEWFRGQVAQRLGTDPRSGYFQDVQRRVLRSRPAPVAPPGPPPQRWCGPRVTADVLLGRDLADFPGFATYMDLESARRLQILVEQLDWYRPE